MLPTAHREQACTPRKEEALGLSLELAPEEKITEIFRTPQCSAKAAGQLQLLEEFLRLCPLVRTQRHHLSLEFLHFLEGLLQAILDHQAVKLGVGISFQIRILLPASDRGSCMEMRNTHLDLIARCGSSDIKPRHGRPGLLQQSQPWLSECCCGRRRGHPRP